MSKNKAIFLDGVIAALILLMAYAFYVGQRPTFMMIVYIMAIYGFIHFVIDSYGFITAPEKEKPPKPRPYERKKPANDIPVTLQEIKMEGEGE